MNTMACAVVEVLSSCGDAGAPGNVTSSSPNLPDGGDALMRVTPFWYTFVLKEPVELTADRWPRATTENAPDDTPVGGEILPANCVSGIVAAAGGVARPDD
jgi:hypothetical protein